MTDNLIVNTVIALFIVIILIIITAKFLKNFYKIGNYVTVKKKKPIFSVLDSLYLDQHNRIISVANENKRYILLLGKNNEQIVEIYEENP